MGRKINSVLQISLYFVSIYHDIPNNPNTFFFNPITPHEIEIRIKKLKNKNQGLDNNPIHILKQIANKISEPLCNMY